MSDTPRTDAHVNGIANRGIDWHYSGQLMSDFARTLERELGEANLSMKNVTDNFYLVKDERDQLKKVNAELTAELNVLKSNHDKTANI